ncbi:hypothetical protein FACS1894199_02970 [Bacteroidia bacterium]|nr:hypothetical protein FACS1894199_02970 [Bacteroidia bacterium]
MMDSFSKVSNNNTADGEPIQFSVVQKNELPEDKKGTLEERNQDYEAAQKRIELEEKEAHYVSSTSFGSAFKQKEAKTEAKTEEVAEVKEDAKETAKGKGNTKQPARYAGPVKKSTGNVATPQTTAAEVPPIQTQPAEVRTKRTRFTDDPTPTRTTTTNAAFSFRVRVFEDVEVINNINMKVRVLEDFTYEGCTIKRNTLLSAIASRRSQTIDIQIQSLMACGKRLVVNFTGYTADGVQGLPVREDNAAEAGTREGGNAMVSGTADAVVSRSSGVLGVVGAAVSSGVRAGTRTAQQKQPVLVEEGRELIFMSN